MARALILAPRRRWARRCLKINGQRHHPGAGATTSRSALPGATTPPEASGARIALGCGECRRPVRWPGSRRSAAPGLSATSGPSVAKWNERDTMASVHGDAGFVESGVRPAYPVFIPKLCSLAYVGVAQSGVGSTTLRSSAGAILALGNIQVPTGGLPNDQHELGHQRPRGEASPDGGAHLRRGRCTALAGRPC